MRKKFKKLMTCTAAVMLGLSCMVYPVHAEEAQSSGQADTGGLLGLDKTAVSLEESTEPQAAPTPETDESEPAIQEQAETEANKEETTNEPVETERETQSEAVKFTNGETKPLEQNEIQENVVPLADTTAFNINENSVNITESGTYVINGTGEETTNTISVAKNLNVMITLNNVNINVSSKGRTTAFIIDGSSTVTVILSGTNMLKSGYERAGLQYNDATEGNSLTITGTGSLNAVGGNTGAGIGGGYFGAGNNITIAGGTIIAKSSSGGGAGIGGGVAGKAQNITISNGNITAQGSDGGAGIGGGGSFYGNPAQGLTNLNISGGTVTAISTNGNGIGDGNTGSEQSDKLIISGGSVKASSDSEMPISRTPIDDNGNNVYLAKLENQDSVNQVTVESNKKFIRAGNHPDNDTAFYLYLTGQDHDLTTSNGHYKATWDNSFTIQIKELYPPTPTVMIDTSKTTASSITVKELENKDTYGGAEYKINDKEWQDSNVFTNLSAGRSYFVYARYKGNDSYIQSETVSVNVSTNTASYTITIPAVTLEAGKEDSKTSIAVDNTKNFDLGYKGHVDVTIKNDTNVTTDAKLKLTQQNDTENHTITSALLVNDTALGNINNNVSTFKAKNDRPVTVSFAKPTETDIPAGTYSGTITFVVSYSEQ